MNTINGDFIEKSIPNTKNATLDINIGGVDSTITVENFANAIVMPPVLPSSTLKLDTNINSTLQTVKDVAGNSSQLQISNDVIKIGKTLLMGNPGTPSGTFTIQGNLAGQTFYDRLWDGVSTATIYALYANDGGFNIYKQIGGSGANVLSFIKVSGYGIFVNGTLYPSKTTAEINNISLPVESLTLWNSTLKTLCYYNGSTWINVKPYKSYVALISQSGTNAPVATVLENTLGGNLTWDYLNTGSYTITSDELFTLNKTSITINNVQYDGATVAALFGGNSTAFINVYTFNAALALTNNRLVQNVIEIRVYN